MNAGRRSNAWCKLIQAPVMISHCYSSPSACERASERASGIGSRIARYKLGASQSRRRPAELQQHFRCAPEASLTASRPAHYPDTQMICGARAICSPASRPSERASGRTNGRLTSVERVYWHRPPVNLADWRPAASVGRREFAEGTKWISRASGRRSQSAAARRRVRVSLAPD